jgi:hypothetical protein
MPCCVTTSSKTDPGGARPNSNALSIDSASSFLVLQEGPSGQGPEEKKNKKSGPYITRLKAFTNYYPQVTIKDGKKIKNPPITIAPFDPAQQAQQAPLWWASSLDAGGTVTIGAEQGIILSVLGIATPNGAHIVLSQFDVPGQVHVLLKNGGQNGPVVHESNLQVQPNAAEDAYQLVSRPPGKWTLLVIHHGKQVEIPVDYVP